MTALDLPDMPDMPDTPDTHEVVVFTDLDGTLLDHDSYSFEAALPALEALAAARIPVVPVTSKTLAELEPLMAALSLSGAAIAENGAVIKLADGRIDRATTRQEIMAVVAALPDEVRRAMRCFSDMSVADIAAATGLSPDAAALAAQREASEPFLWRSATTPEDAGLRALDTALDTAVEEAGFCLTQGGRFHHIIPPRDKADAIALLLAEQNPRPVVWALGDGPNDIAMLLAADRGALIANPHIDTQKHLPPGHNLYISAKTGPQGWRDAIATFLGHNFE